MDRFRRGVRGVDEDLVPEDQARAEGEEKDDQQDAEVTSSSPFRYPCAVHRWIRVKSAAVERKERPHRPLPGFPGVLTGTMCWPASIMRLNESAATQTVSSSPTCSIDLMYLWPVRATPAW